MSWSLHEFVSKHETLTQTKYKFLLLTWMIDRPTTACFMMSSSSMYNKNKFDHSIWLTIQLTLTFGSISALIHFRGCFRKIVFNTVCFFSSVIDSTGKTPTGLLDFTYADFGEYDQCLNIKNTDTNSDTHTLGKYCLVSLLPDEILTSAHLENNPLVLSQQSHANHSVDQLFNKMFEAESNFTLMLGFCIPSQCKESDLRYLLNSGNSTRLQIIISFTFSSLSKTLFYFQPLTY